MACFSPVGVNIKWLGVQVNLCRPRPPATSKFNHSSVSPFLKYSTIFFGDISPVSGFMDITSTGIRWLTILPIFSDEPSANVTRVS